MHLNFGTHDQSLLTLLISMLDTNHKPRNLQGRSKQLHLWLDSVDVAVAKLGRP